MNIYERFGVAPIINALGPATRLGGALMDPEVVAAMSEAARCSVDMTELQAAASRFIATITGAEAGLVSSGAAAALLLGAAACVTGLDPAKMSRLPDTRGMRNRAVVPRSHRNLYDHAVRTAGVELVEVGIPDRFSGAGVRDCEPWEIEAAIDERTALLLYVATDWSEPSLEQVVAIGKKHGIPVLVDAAAQLPPADNLRRFIAVGADLVAFSGGKALGGPQSSGLLCGRRELITAAALQLLDLDVRAELWNPPAEFIAHSALPGPPPHGIGRPCKAGKEEIIGLLVALERFASEPDRQRPNWENLIATLQANLGSISGCEITRILAQGIPYLDITFGGPAPQKRAISVALRLQNGEPAVVVSTAAAATGTLRLGPCCLTPAQIPAIARSLLRAVADP